nr:MAG TPA: hypothetical protein [Caudoviricetes sp.]
MLDPLTASPRCQGAVMYFLFNNIFYYACRIYYVQSRNITLGLSGNFILKRDFVGFGDTLFRKFELKLGFL